MRVILPYAEVFRKHKYADDKVVNKLHQQLMLENVECNLASYTATINENQLSLETFTYRGKIYTFFVGQNFIVSKVNIDDPGIECVEYTIFLQ